MATHRRVFLSHTSEFTKFPEKKSFIDAAIAAVNRAGCVPCDMGYFTARDEKPAQFCKERVREYEVYVGIIGLRYGSPVRDRPEVSYTELEFEAACEPKPKTRLVFFLDQHARVPVGVFSDNQFGNRQTKFRKRIHDAGVMCQSFSDVHELEKLIYQALIEGAAGFEEKSGGQDRIDWPQGQSPYPGLLSFDQQYAELFFGRDREVNAVLAKMSEPEGRFLIISGTSGSGKSSLVAAGVWRALLKQERLPGSSQWIWVRIQPGDGKRPFDSLAWGLKQAFPGIVKRPEDLANELAENKTTIGELLTPYLMGDQELLLFIDQLEELFTQGFKDGEIQNFLEQLVANIRDKNNRLRLVATVRSEFIARLEESESIRELLNSGYNYHLGPVSPMNLHDMVDKPASATGYDFEPELVEDILREAAQEPGNLPLVAYALKQLFERRRKGTFTLDAYKDIHGVAGAIGAQADQVMAGLDAEARGAFDKVFAELVHIDRDRPPTRKRVALAAFSTDEGAHTLIRALAGPDCRVLVTGGVAQDASVEVAHEKLFTAWPQLNDWIEKGGDALRLIEYATEAGRRWQDSGESPQELWLATRATEVLAALQQFSKKPSPVLDRFVRPQQALINYLAQESLSHQQRALIGGKLAEFGDSRPGVGLREDGLPDIEWVEIPEGQVKLEEVEHPFKVKAFRIARYLVTNMQFEAFINAEDGYRNKEWWKGIIWSEAPAPPSWNEANAPRETVSWFEAVAFCRWLSQRMGENIRLPAEWEWQQAATGGDPEREYPWSGGWDATRCNSVESRLKRTSTVGMYPSGVTRQGVLDMVGNVWERCLNKYDKPETPESLRIDGTDERRVGRGGSWGSFPGSLRSSYRNWNFAAYRSGTIGFRLAQGTR
ncbi:MAG: SUMF1/EgtB/PvdO family nonheme iron enzyme [Nitrospinae bacterium]|nr:SUMF1/EgtB/PvdO family nonheme iron enzyme [Nitrospinota bacterium]